VTPFLMDEELLRGMTVPNDLYLGTGRACPIAIRNVLAFCRLKATDLGGRKNFHHRFVLCFNLHRSASINVVVDNVALALSPGQYFLLFPHQLHAYPALAAREVAVLFVTFESEDGEFLSPLRSRIMDLEDPVQGRLESFLREFSRPQSGRKDSLLVLSLQVLLETILDNSVESIIDPRIPLSPPLVATMAAMADGTFFTVGSVAQRVGLSEAYLRRLFKQRFGINLGHYLLELRQNKARTLLGSSDENVSRIAELCGYTSIYAFSRSFHAFHGCSPTVYRESVRAQAQQSRRSIRP